MAFGFESKQPPWSTATQLWLLEQSQNGRTQQEVYNDLIAETSSTRPDIVPRWTGKFGTFKKRYQRLCRNGSDLQSATDIDDMPEYDLATARGRYSYWVYLAQNTNSLATRTQALQMIEKLAPQFVGQDEDDDDGMTPAQRRTRGQHLLNDWHAFSEVVATELAEHIAKGDAAGVTNLLADILNASTTTPMVRNDVIARVLEQHPQVMIEETSEERVRRIFNEVRNLSAEEQEQLVQMEDDYDAGRPNIDDVESI